MTRALRNWMSPLLIVLAAVVSFAVSPSVPDSVSLPLNRLVPFGSLTDVEPASGTALLYTMPAVALFIWALLRWLSGNGATWLAKTMRHDAPAEVTSAEQFARFASTYDTIVLGVVVLVLGLHAAALAAALGKTEVAIRLVPIVAGASLVMIGNVFPRLKPNWVAGIRTKRTLADPALWRTTHRTSGAAFVVAGLVTMLAGVFAPSYGLVVAFGSLIVALLVGGLAASRSGGATAVVVVVLVCANPVEAKGQLPLLEKIIELPTPAHVVETPFSFSRSGRTMHGTIARPRTEASRMPVVLIVAGSGATDRNANGPTINTNAYAMLAWALAERGIATARYDKRGIGQSAVTDGDPTKLSLDDYQADVRSAAESLAADPRFSRVILLGHSEGAGLVVQAANRGAPVSGVIMVSAQGRKFGDLIREQFARQTDSSTVVRIDSAFARLLRGEDPGDVPPIARHLIVPVAANFLRSFVAYDPPAEVKRYAGPLLILQGVTDIQTTMDDARLLAAAQPRATFLALDGVNHVLKQVESTAPREQVASYRDPHLPLAPAVAPAIARWIQTNKGDRASK